MAARDSNGLEATVRAITTRAGGLRVERSRVTTTIKAPFSKAVKLLCLAGKDQANGHIAAAGESYKTDFRYLEMSGQP